MWQWRLWVKVLSYTFQSHAYHKHEFSYLENIATHIQRQRQKKIEQNYIENIVIELYGYICAPFERVYWCVCVEKKMVEFPLSLNKFFFHSLCSTTTFAILICLCNSFKKSNLKENISIIFSDFWFILWDILPQWLLWTIFSVIYHATVVCFLFYDLSEHKMPCSITVWSLLSIIFFVRYITPLLYNRMLLFTLFYQNKGLLETDWYRTYNRTK